MAKPKAGEKYRVTQGWGNNTPDAPNGAIREGREARVAEIVPADVRGAHTDTEDAVVLEFDEPYLGQDDDGNPVVAYTTRRVAVGFDFLAEHAEKVK